LLQTLEVVSPLNRPNQEKSDIFKPSRFEALYQPYFCLLMFACQDVVGSQQKGSKKDSWYQEYSVLLTAAKPGVCGSRRHLCPKPPESFKSKLRIFWLKKRLINLQKSFCFCNFNRTWITFGSLENVRL